jgi:hypothetical protein
LREVAERIYSSLNKATSRLGIKENSTAVGKSMHILQPRLFLIWDSYVRKPRNYEDSFSGYWKYAKNAQAGLREAVNDFRKVNSAPLATESDIEERLYFNGWKSIAKIYDEACWAMAQGYLHFY